MNIRTALTGEGSLLAPIDAAQHFSAHWSAAQTESEIAHPAGRVLVCEEQGTILGFIAFRCAAGEGEVFNLAVEPAHVRKGAGYLLVTGALEEMRQANTTRATLEVNEHNVAALALYRKTGFSVLGRRKKFYNNAEDALIMGINL